MSQLEVATAATPSGWSFARSFPPGDPQLPAIEALIRALGMRNVDDRALCLDACLRDVQEVGISDQ
jgi:hypothetical protein